MTESVTLWHNPRCSKSRQALALLEDRGVDVTVVRYLDTPPSVAELKDVLKQLGITPRELMRRKEAEYKALELDQDGLSDDALIQAMVSHPKLIERPVAISSQGAVIGRPPENVLTVVAS